jgi:hypothetical protein
MKKDVAIAALVAMSFALVALRSAMPALASGPRSSIANIALPPGSTLGLPAQETTGAYGAHELVEIWTSGFSSYEDTVQFMDSSLPVRASLDGWPWCGMKDTPGLKSWAWGNQDTTIRVRVWTSNSPGNIGITIFDIQESCANLENHRGGGDLQPRRQQ